MELIQSRQNPRVKRLVRLAGSVSFRRSEGLLLVEGVHLLLDAARSGRTLEQLILTPRAQEREEVKALLPDLSVNETLLLSPDCYRKFSLLKSPEGVACLVRDAPADPGIVFSQDARLVVLAGIQDPGNAGAILRTAEAAGMSGAVLLEPSVDITHPSLLRATMGACFRLPMLAMTPESFLEAAGSLHLLAAHGTGGKDYREAQYAAPFALVIGAEGGGIPDALLRRTETVLSIPMAGATESLNAAVAAGLLMYESARAR